MVTTRRGGRSVVRRAVVLAVLAFGTLVPGARAQAVDGAGTDLLVTVAARACPDFDAISANLARNNIQESLRDLGPDTAYRAGDAVDPGTEAANQPRCTPITGWRFTLGTGIRSRASTGTWGALSTVSGTLAGPGPTLATTPLLDRDGRPLDPPRSLAGAVTFELDAQQAKLASRSSALWIQGGTPTDPVLDEAFPGAYGFGALRCAVDDLNGDNVEWIQFPSGSRHVFCFAYYVQPPPTSGTIVIRKEVRGSSGTAETFTFAGNLSYAESRTFDLTADAGKPGQQTFYRAATTPDAPWTVSERVPPGWRASPPKCTGAASPITVAGGEASIALAAGDTVTCAFTNTFVPPPGQLLIRKVTSGGIGAFAFAVRPFDEDDIAARATGITLTQDDAYAARPAPIDLDPGAYRVTEDPPQPSRRGAWAQTGASCVPGDGTSVRITSRAGSVCTFTNEFTPAGSIRLAKVTRGAAGTTGFEIARVADPATEYRKTATTTQTDRLVPAAGGTSTRGIPLGHYVITETRPTTPLDGDWSLAAVRCNGRVVPFAEGRVEVVLTRAEPSVGCVFVNRFAERDPPDPAPVPVPPLPPEPPADLTPLPPGGATADLVLSKRTDRAAAAVGDVLRYRITIRNQGNSAAERVVLVDQPGARGQLTGASTVHGRCDDRERITCRLGRIAPGETAAVTVGMRLVAPGIARNFAAVGSESRDAVLADNASGAAVRVEPARDRTGCAALVARAAC